jgi:hypothetical protein
MLLALVLLAQTAAATPALVASSVPLRKFSGGFGRTATVGAPRVTIGPDDVKAAPTPAPEPYVPGLRSAAPAPVVAAAKAPAAAPAPAVSDEDQWRGRYEAAKAKLASALAQLHQAERTWGDVVSFGQRTQAHEIMLAERDTALLPFRMKVQDAERELGAIREECRRTTGCAPGWVR